MISTSMQTPSGALPTVPATCSAQQKPSGRAWATRHLPKFNDTERLNLKARTRFTWRITDKGAVPTIGECRMADQICNPFDWYKREEQETDWHWPIQSDFIFRSNKR